MLLFLDTEYTSSKRGSKLISLALVAQDGSREFYVELADTWQTSDCSDFVLRTVLPLLDNCCLSFTDARSALHRWFLAAPRAVQVACDSGIDWLYLLELLGPNRPENLLSERVDLRRMIDTTVYDQAVQAYYLQDPREHHALADARAYRQGWLAWMDARKGEARSVGARQ
ncbi:3'-5' exoribonuclease [Caballeronia sordidicola]|uniref:3'-5' exoribonuclease n=1 Tax=Caballeronia sordidicola TaxID=196367 RepID=UPI00094C1F3D|nr:3'-5' exoribonuclease [Caballeronia sordidicola]